MKKFLLPLAATLFLATGTATAQEESQPTPAPAQGQAPQQNPVEQMIDIYATVLFAAEVERRCDHLDSGMEVVLYNNLITIETYMTGILPPQAVTSLRNGAAQEAANEEANPCGDQTKEFISRVFPVAANIALNILQRSEGQQGQPEGASAEGGGTAVPDVTLGDESGVETAPNLDLGPGSSGEDNALDLGQAPDDPDEE